VLGIRTKFKCEDCRISIFKSVDSYYSIQVERIIPKLKGEPDEFNDLSIACKNCNFIKRICEPRKIMSQEFHYRENLLDEAKDYIQEKG